MMTIELKKQKFIQSYYSKIAKTNHWKIIRVDIPLIIINLLKQAIHASLCQEGFGENPANIYKHVYN